MGPGQRHSGWWTSTAGEALSDAPTGPYHDQSLWWPQNEDGKGHNAVPFDGATLDRDLQKANAENHSQDDSSASAKNL